MKKRVKSTFLLRCVVLIASLAIFAAACFVCNFGGMSLGTFAFLVIFWSLGVECNLLPILLEWIMVRRGNASTDACKSLWFVPIESARNDEFDKHIRGTSNNPTIR